MYEYTYIYNAIRKFAGLRHGHLRRARAVRGPQDLLQELPAQRAGRKRRLAGTDIYVYMCVRVRVVRINIYIDIYM